MLLEKNKKYKVVNNWNIEGSSEKLLKAKGFGTGVTSGEVLSYQFKNCLKDVIDHVVIRRVYELGITTLNMDNKKDYYFKMCIVFFDTREELIEFAKRNQMMDIKTSVIYR